MSLSKKINKRNGVVIFGAGVVGEVIFEACKMKHISVVAFTDNNINKCSQKIKGVPVIYPPEILKFYPSVNVIISVSDIQDVVKQLEGMGIVDWLAGVEEIRNFDFYQYEYSKPIEFVEYAINTAILCQDNFLTPDKIFLRSVDVVNTERCSLQCRDCSNLMRYYKNPKDINLNEIIKDIDSLCKLVDEINEFRVIGGEPFMNAEAHILIKRLADEPKVKKVVIYTNGTILPRPEQIEIMRNKKILFFITDYGYLSRSLVALEKVLKENKIAFYIQKTHDWTDCSVINKHNRTITENDSLFIKCCSKNTYTLLKGKLYRCPFSANADNLRAVPNFVGDYVDIRSRGVTVKKMKKIMRHFLLDLPFLSACDYCNGRSFDDPEIIPAVQQFDTRDYVEYFEKEKI
ncbi:MAG: radical SAM protein [Candidatus Shapirobacteria bacterium]|nr:radical SAM protein [Candidatus Shapirobacteria bacterium]